MDSWFELQRIAHDGPGKHTGLEDAQSDAPQVGTAKDALQEAGMEWPQDGSLISFKGFTGEQFYKKFAEDLSKELDGKTKLKVHPSFAWNPKTTPSVLEIPVDEMLQNANRVNALLDKYLQIKRNLFGGPQPPSVSSN